METPKEIKEVFTERQEKRMIGDKFIINEDHFIENFTDCGFVSNNFYIQEILLKIDELTGVQEIYLTFCESEMPDSKIRKKFSKTGIRDFKELEYPSYENSGNNIYTLIFVRENDKVTLKSITEYSKAIMNNPLVIALQEFKIFHSIKGVYGFYDQNKIRVGLNMNIRLIIFMHIFLYPIC